MYGVSVHRKSFLRVLCLFSAKYVICIEFAVLSIVLRKCSWVKGSGRTSALFEFDLKKTKEFWSHLCSVADKLHNDGRSHGGRHRR